jgi:hypothetical protein
MQISRLVIVRSIWTEASVRVQPFYLSDTSGLKKGQAKFLKTRRLFRGRLKYKKMFTTVNHGKWFRFMATLSLNFPGKETQTLTPRYVGHVQMLLENRPIILIWDIPIGVSDHKCAFIQLSITHTTTTS